MYNYLKAPIIWMFVRVISGFVALRFKSPTTSTVVFVNKSSDKLEASDAEATKNEKHKHVYNFNSKS